MAFEVFEGKHTRGSKDPGVSVRKGGALAINRPCAEQWFKAAPFAILLFDSDTGRAAVRPVQEAATNTYRIQYSKQGGAQINTRQFSAHYDLKRDKSRSYEATWDDSAKAIVFKPEREKR
jgi:hypothetical protein